MPSSLFWIDYDGEARDRTQRILQLFEERDTRDELGIGAIRDSFSDLLFPGTSTIHTRLRYFLIIPWVYQEIEKGSTPTHRIADEVRTLELDVTEHLMDAGETAGVFGRTVGRGLKTLPSSIYWAGLREWGIRDFDGSRMGYHASIDGIRNRRKKLDRRTEEDWADIPMVRTWHPGLPKAPDGFPKLDTLELSRDEASFIQERVADRCPGTLLSILFLDPIEMTSDFPWQDPRTEGLPRAVADLLDAGRRFSKAMHGASLLYNLLLARAADRDERVTDYEDRLASWGDELDLGELGEWDLDSVWSLIEHAPHTITPTARSFVAAWLDLLRTRRPSEIAVAEDAARLIRMRERRMKGKRARLENPRMLEQWGGASNPDPLEYRWSQMKVYGNDLWRAVSE